MINTKPNNSIKLLLFIGIFVSLLGCETNESFTFQKRTIAIGDFFDCEISDCVVTEIFLLEAINESEISKNINTEIEKAAAAFLDLDDTTSIDNMEKAIKAFNTSYQELKNEFPEEIVPYEASINCEISFRNQTILSVFIDSYIFTGGAHGSGNSSYLNISPKTGKVIESKILIKDYSKFSSFAEKKFRKKHSIPEGNSINSTGFFFDNNTFILPSTIGFTDTHVILLYNQYEISSYAEGPIELKIEKEIASEYFSVKIL